MNKLDCWWISMNFEQKKEIVCDHYSNCENCMMEGLCNQYDQREDIPEKDLEIEDVFNGKTSDSPLSEMS